LFARLAVAHPGRYLDFACGTGRILEVGAPHFGEVVGIDVSDTMLAEAARRVPSARLVRADVMADPPDVGQFSVISLFRFILSAQHHLREGVLGWLRSVIEPDGVLVLNNHLNHHSLTGMRHRIRHAVRREPGRSPTDRSMASLLDHNGFEIVESYGFGVVPPWRERPRVPSTALLRLERLLSSREVLQRVAKDRIYVCQPSQPSEAKKAR
jgi:SAM-dependent methyltransferase